MSQATFCRRPVRPARPMRARPMVEQLEGRLVPSTNVLVNDPGADHTVYTTQSETTLVLGAGNRVVVAFNDNGARAAGDAFSPQLTGYAVSPNGGNNFRDQGTLPSLPRGD